MKKYILIITLDDGNIKIRHYNDEKAIAREVAACNRCIKEFNVPMHFIAYELNSIYAEGAMK